MTVAVQRQAGRRGGRGRLTRSADFDRVFRQGRSHATRHLVLHVFSHRPVAQEAGDEAATDAHGPRLGLSVGRKVGGAVERNRVKRLMREAFAALAPELPPGYDFVLVARAEADELARREGEAGFESELRELVARSGLAP